MSQVNMPSVQIQEYDYQLPDDRIAKYPKEKRDESKLLVFKNQEVTHHTFKEIPELLPADACLVFNNTKVIPARILIGKSTGAVIELFLLRPNVHQNFTEVLQNQEQFLVWEALVGNKKRWKAGDELQQKIEVDGEWIEVRFSWEDREQNLVRIAWNHQTSMAALLTHLGKTPLPPYMSREATSQDEDRYQTIFSKELGAVAAPTASLHFTQDTFHHFEQKGIQHLYLTLHVGAGTFLPVKEEDVSKHPMHREQVVISKAFIQALLAQKGPIIPVGTTAMRALESLYWSGVWLLEAREWDKQTMIIPKEFPYLVRELVATQTAVEAVWNYLDQNHLHDWVFETEILIMPGYQLRFCHALVTNFHQPKSTLMVLIAALVGNSWKKIYDSALANEYRFLSYGDSSLLFNQNI